MKISRKFIPNFYFFYSFIFLIYGAYNDFGYFVDSRNYIDGLAGYSYETIIAQYRFILVPLLWLYLNLRIYKILSNVTSAFLIFILINPYVQLLLTNYTKELFIIFITCLAFQGSSGFRENIGLAVLNLIRPIYLLFFIKNKFFKFFLIIGLVVFVKLYDDFINYISLAENFIYSRSNVAHIGRDFFNYLCVQEKSSIQLFLSCTLTVFIGIPIHQDVLSINYLIFLNYQIAGFVLLVSCIKNKRIILFLIYVISYFAIFFLSPTFGAFLRYFTPVLFLTYFLQKKDINLIKKRQV